MGAIWSILNGKGCRISTIHHPFSSPITSASQWRTHPNLWSSGDLNFRCRRKLWYLWYMTVVQHLITIISILVILSMVFDIQRYYYIIRIEQKNDPDSAATGNRSTHPVSRNWRFKQLLDPSLRCSLTSVVGVSVAPFKEFDGAACSKRLGRLFGCLLPPGLT